MLKKGLKECSIFFYKHLAFIR